MSHFAPRLLWILRDHVLLTRDLKGNKVSAKEYLESVLQDVPVGKDGYWRSVDSINVWKSILNFFRYWDCITMVRPTDKESDMRNL